MITAILLQKGCRFIILEENIISIVLNAPNDKINSLTGKLNIIEGVSANKK